MGTKRQDIRTLSKRHPKLETLMNRVDKESLIRQHRLQKRDKAPGIDMVTKEVYGTMSRKRTPKIDKF